MNVAELIVLLQKQPPDRRVIISGIEGDYDDAEKIIVIAISANSNPRKEHFMGKHGAPIWPAAEHEQALLIT